MSPYDRILAAIERLALRGENVTNRSVLRELRAPHGKGASFSTIRPIVAAWHGAHPVAQPDDPARGSGSKSRSVASAVPLQNDREIVERLVPRDCDGGQAMEALRQEIAGMTLLLQTIADRLARQNGTLQSIDRRFRTVLIDRSRHQAGTHPSRRRTVNPKTSPSGMADRPEVSRPPKSTLRRPASRPGNTVAARAFGRSVVVAVFDVLMARAAQAPNRPAMAADDIIAALHPSLRSAIETRIGRSPDRAYLVKLLRPRVERARYVRCDSSGRYIAIPDWREHRLRARQEASPV